MVGSAAIKQGGSANRKHTYFLGGPKWDLRFVIYMFLTNNTSSGGYKFFEFVFLFMNFSLSKGQPSQTNSLLPANLTGQLLISNTVMFQRSKLVY